MTLKTIGLIITLALTMLSAPLGSDAQQTKRMSRVGALWPFEPNEAPHLREAFRHGLRELGYVEGQSIDIEWRWGKPDRLPDLAAELVRLRVDVIVAAAPPPIQAAKHATTAIPIVMVTLADPVVSGYVASLARPGGNLTGLTGIAPELSGKRLQILKEAVPRISHVALLANPANPTTAQILRETLGAARALRLQLRIVEARTPGEFDAAFAATGKERADALIVASDPIFFAQRKQIVDLVAKRRLPAIYTESREWVEAGGLMSYAADLADMFRRTATYVDKILKGAKPADLPVEQPTKFELAINLKTARALGVTIPKSLLLRADRVIQ